jgi:hypothetical protein
MKAGLTVPQLVAIAGDFVPTERIGSLMERVPLKYFDPQTQLYRPITPGIIAALDRLGTDGCAENDQRLADTVELASADPEGAADSWTLMPDGTDLYIGSLLLAVGDRLAALYAPPKQQTRRRRTISK